MTYNVSIKLQVSNDKVLTVSSDFQNSIQRKRTLLCAELSIIKLVQCETTLYAFSIQPLSCRVFQNCCMQHLKSRSSNKQIISNIWKSQTSYHQSTDTKDIHHSNTLSKLATYLSEMLAQKAAPPQLQLYLYAALQSPADSTPLQQHVFVHKPTL